MCCQGHLYFQCEPLDGFGLQRGGYQCVCRKGLYYPWGQNGPFQGVDIEQSTEEQYTNGTFDCVTPEGNVPGRISSD